MLADLVHVTTEDGVTLDGAHLTGAPGRSSAIDAVLWLHGDTMNFYTSIYLELGEAISSAGISFLSANRRGHDIVARATPPGQPAGQPLGMAFELISDSVRDVEAWLRHLRVNGHRRVVLGGHSGGALRAIYAQATRQFDGVVGVVGASPPELSYAFLAETYGEDFTAVRSEASRGVDEGNGAEIIQPGVPLSAWYSKRTYVDTFNPDDRYSVSTLVDTLTLPTLLAVGSDDHPLCRAAHDGIASRNHEHTSLCEIDGANHGYVGRMPQLADVIVEWLPTI